MSVKVMGLVWDADLERDLKFILMAYADHAEHDGEKVYPSIGLIAWKTGYSERQVQRYTQELVRLKILIPKGDSHLGTRLYKIDLAALKERAPFEGKGRRGRPVKKGDTDDTDKSPTYPEMGDKEAVIGDIPEENGDKTGEIGDIAMSYDSSFKPSLIKPPIESSLPPDGGTNGHRTKVEYQAEILQSLSKGLNRDYELKTAVEDEFHILPNWDTTTGKSFLTWLKKRPEDETVEDFKKWWYANDWRGKDGQSPSLSQIREYWPQAVIASIDRQFRELDNDVINNGDLYDKPWLSLIAKAKRIKSEKLLEIERVYEQYCREADGP